ncbi:BrnA antitoxin family protein [Phyllobacterium sp. P30BS-XVII]|uniref:BrnA antitoxin family protein n=1 Tax=Phyllobacterium sp. P30BS-XVII TaxID=2587046 RepID=UPI000DD97153|nr:BrnA antitoxin family protein [Phyllobacterium sp. P30BS-XVII]MBA8902869.1 uncharacterized protein (DUF4415 family) [Phyllobacterium sp. P30BS-XVII]
MTAKWPSFITKDLGKTPEDDAEMTRRWEVYDREMQALIAAGGVHMDDDGWWVDDATGELIGPDPEIERPLTDEELTRARPFKDVFPELYESIQRARGRPPVDTPKKQITLRVDQDVIAKFKATGKGWQSRINEVLKQAKVK